MVGDNDMGHTELQNYVVSDRGQYILSKALSVAARYFNPSDDAREMATILTKYFPQFPELLNTNIINDVILNTKTDDTNLTFWEAMAEVAWSAKEE